jgi:hypothetical protein
MKNKCTFDESECLQTNPFEGDFGMPGDRNLRDQIVTARKIHECDMCFGKIVIGSRYRTMIEFFEGRMEPYKYCCFCCRAMSKNWTDEGKDWESRISLGRKRWAKDGNRI